MRNNENYYREEIMKMLSILENNDSELTIAKSYVKEKMKSILMGNGIGLHPSLNLSTLNLENSYTFKIYEERLEKLEKRLLNMRGNLNIIRKDGADVEKEIIENEKVIDRERKAIGLEIIKEKI